MCDMNGNCSRMLQMESYIHFRKFDQVSAMLHELLLFFI